MRMMRLWERQNNIRNILEGILIFITLKLNSRLINLLIIKEEI